MRTDSIVFCPLCGEKRKSYKSKVLYDKMLSDKSKGKIVFYCTNHPYIVHFCIEVLEVNDSISSMRIYVMYDKIPKEWKEKFIKNVGIIV